MYEWVQSALVGVADDFPLAVIHQGVNRQMFEPMPVARPDNLKDKFVVLSSGKFEMRKGQDVVVEAFRRFRKEVPSAVLSFAWDNLWTESMLSMTNSKYMDLKDLVCTEVNGNILISGINHDLIPRENQAVWRIGPNNQMVYFYNHADLAVFPNRCEAGQTLPALEAMACGLPCVIPEWTGMEDLVALTSGSPSVKVLKRGLQIKDHRSAHSFGFYEPCIDEVVSQMMAAYLEREKNKPNDLPKLMMSFEWRSTASGLVNLIRKVVK
jgi:glycosyltransferase involved in cell wall biosynthesis